MIKGILGISVILIGGLLSAQVVSTDTTTNAPLNSAQNILSGNGGKQIIIGGYAQIDYNQPFNDTASANGKMDVHRMIIFMGYKFNDKVQFVTEIEMEHVKELYVEQAFINYQVNSGLGIRAGLMLIPMGIINEYHETTTFNGVERPNLDGVIVPSTWREMGAGIAGNLDQLSLKYQAYVVNGFLGYDGVAKLRGVDGFRKGRQKAAESTFNSPNFSSKIDYYGIKGLKIGASAYYGNTQSTAFDGLPNNDTLGLKEQADSSTVGLAMFGLDARYQYKAFQARAQFIKASISNVNEYNGFTGSDLGSSMLGYYGELGYDVLSLFNKGAKEKIILFGRYEYYDTHNATSENTDKNYSFARTDITLGVTYKVSNGAAFKADYQIFDNEADGNTPSRQINLGIGVWF
ncbi:MAG: hypothetical protein P1U41_02140 [Vicingaceae bacterium]|nr:hypothetical protein [Vicingaceae bacterium]